MISGLPILAALVLLVLDILLKMLKRQLNIICVIFGKLVIIMPSSTR
jgi:hypothetical protein